VSTVAHELRTPITALKGLALTLMRADDRLDSAKQRELFGRLSERADSMEHLVEELLTMSRLAAGKVNSTPVPIDLERHVTGLLDDLTTILPDVRTDLQPDAVAVADPDHLARILINLLDNARRYGAPPLEVRTRQDGGVVELVVCDHGRGITAEDAERLFERFEQLDHRGEEGLGLGLSIVRSLAELNDGDVRYVDTPEGGATFIVRLPAGDQQDLVMHHHIRSATAGT
jgi:signal transduction histidine kinase